MTPPAIRFDVVTLFPELFTSGLSTSLLGKAVTSGAICVGFTDPRTFTTDKHHSVDDTPYGGGAGMVMRPEPLARAIESIDEAHGQARKILMCPTGRRATQRDVAALSKHSHVTFICGRYEGYDDRVRTLVDDVISLGDFVLTGGELAALVLIDAVARLVPGVLGNDASAVDESHSHGVLEYPQYTRPPEWRGLKVPDVLVSGHHERIRRWRRLQSLERTKTARPDLFVALELSNEDRALLAGEDP